MTPEEARRILGLSTDEDPTAHLGEFSAARERIAELVRTAPNETIAMRYQSGLIEFDQALTTIREELNKEPAEVVRHREWMSAARGVPIQSLEEPQTPNPAKTVPLEVAPKPTVPDEPVPQSPTPPAKDVKSPPDVPETQEVDEEEDLENSRGAAIFFVFLLLIGAAAFGYWKYDEHQQIRTQERVTALEKAGAKHIDSRRWPEAKAAYDKIEELRPGSDAAKIGRHSIEIGMEEEQRQFVAYWSGEAIAAFDLGRLDDAAAAAQSVLDKYPNQPEIRELMGKIDHARETQAREMLTDAAKEAILKRRWDEAEEHAAKLLAQFPDALEGPSLLSEIKAGREKEVRDKARARELFAAAKVRDQGVFDSDVLEWLREATALSPDDSEITALYKKVAAYTRTLEVPGDYSTLPEAVDAARDRDRIVVGEGTWAGPLVMDKAIQIEGAGQDKTIIEVEASVSTAATFGRNASGARVSGITFRHRGFDSGPNRFSVLLVRGSEVTMNDCRIADSAGHGLAVMEAGIVGATRCVFENNGWDGVAVRGAGSRIEFTECQSNSNFGHGYDIWDGGSAAIHNSSARENAVNGILVDTVANDIVLGENDLRSNREYGIVLASAASGRVHGNVCRENLVGGMAVQFSAGRLTYDSNRFEKNQGPGLALEKGLNPQSFATDRATGNARGKNVVTNADFSGSE